LCVANWLEHKDILGLLEAVAQLPDRLATLHLAGDDPPDPPVGARGQAPAATLPRAGGAPADPRSGARVQARLARPDLAGRVVVHGPLPAEQVAVLYREAAVLALPSLRESYGRVWGEAMAAGLPAVG